MGISACLIVKNEAHRLQLCLESIRTVVDEIIIVDTGSEDQTVAIAQNYTDKIYTFEWCDDFSAARNESLKHASQDWILVIDADEVLEARSAQLLPQILESHDKKCPLLLNARVLTPGKQDIFTKAFFPNHLGIEFKSKVHEWPALNGQWLSGINCPDLVFLQRGTNPKQQASKLQYYHQLLREAIAVTEDPYEKTIYFKHLGEGLQELGVIPAAQQAFESARTYYHLSQAFPTRLIYHQILVALIHLHLAQEGKPWAYCLELTENFPKYSEGWLLQGYVAFLLGDLKACEAALSQPRQLDQLPVGISRRLQAQFSLLEGRLALLRTHFPQGLLSLEKAWILLPGPELAWHLCRGYWLKQDFLKAQLWAEEAQANLVSDWENLLFTLPLWSELEQAQLIRRNSTCTPV